jgi:iron complex outermembrane receptor protein
MPLVSGTDMPLAASVQRLVAFQQGGNMCSKQTFCGWLLLCVPLACGAGALQERPVSTSAVDSAASSNAQPEARRNDVEQGRIPEVLVIGSRVLNTDIPRTEDDAQPYVVFDRETILRSGVSNVEEFLRERLTMNTQGSIGNQSGNSGNVSRINLRGLGLNQTLILVDGHRTTSTISAGTPDQPDINGIPIAAVERIEVLPTTASGIYGGAATGGVVNIVLRRDFVGTEFNAKYDNTLDTDTGITQLGLTSALDVGADTNLLVSVTYHAANDMLQANRGYLERGRREILRNNPAFYLNATVPPVGATTNIRSVNGSPLFGPGTPNFTTVPVGYTSAQGIAPLRAMAGQYNFDLPESGQLTAGKFNGLLQETTNWSALTTLRHSFGERVNVFLEAIGAERRAEFQGTAGGLVSYTIAANAPNNPFGQAIRVSVPNAILDNRSDVKVREYRVLGGVIVRLPGEWSATADFNWGRFWEHHVVSPTLSGAEAAAISNGSLDVLRDREAFQSGFLPFVVPPRKDDPGGALSREMALRAAGPVAHIGDTGITLSTLLTRRDESFDATVTTLANGERTLLPGKSQLVDSAYAEFRAPLVSQSNAVAGIRELELQVAGRHDRYETHGVTLRIVESSATQITRQENRVHSTNPTVGLRYVPVDGLMLRGSWGTGFLPPAVTQLTPNGALSNINFAGATDPLRANEPVGTVQVRGGGNPDLVPEESENTSFGIVATPSFLEGLRLSVDYTRIHKTDNIAGPTSFALADFASFAAVYPERISRAAPAPGDPFPVGRINFINVTLTNIAQVTATAYDLSLDYRLQTESYGSFDFYADATRMVEFEEQLHPATAVVDDLGIGINPPEWNANAGLTWSLGAWSLGWSGRYIDSYLANDDPVTILNQGNDGYVRSQTLHNLFARYRFRKDLPLFEGLDLQLGCNNVFDSEPRMDARDTVRLYSGDGDVRGRSFYLVLRASL